ARVGLQTGGVVAVSVGDFALRARIEQRDLRIEEASQSPAQYLEADTLAGFDVDLVVIARLHAHRAGDDAWDGNRLRRRLGNIRPGLHNLGQIVDAKEPEV